MDKIQNIFVVNVKMSPLTEIKEGGYNRLIGAFSDEFDPYSANMFDRFSFRIGLRHDIIECPEIREMDRQVEHEIVDMIFKDYDPLLVNDIVLGGSYDDIGVLIRMNKFKDPFVDLRRYQECIDGPGDPGDPHGPL